MYYSEYLNACRNFAQETRNWSYLPVGRFFTTNDSEESGWTETCDNAHGGLDVSWAFGKEDDYIEKYAPGTYAGMIAQTAVDMLDNEADPDTLRDWLSEFVE